MADEEDGQLSGFLEWCTKNGMDISSKVRVGRKGSCHRYGMVAVENIYKGECLFEIPRTLVLRPETSAISHILVNLEEEETLHSERSGWVPLLLALMYEYSILASFWKPYLNLTPDVGTLDQPLFWSAEERQVELAGTGIEDDVESDVQHLEEEYQTIVVPFIRKNSKYFSESIHTLSLYKHMAAFIMAYSFTDENSHIEGERVTLMVPMADILNHISNNNAHLEFGTESLKMLATCDINKGNEVYNTYGKLGNCHLLQSYGFVEEFPNPYDMVEIPLSSFYEVLKTGASPRAVQLLDAKFNFMEEMGVTSMEDLLLFGRDGCSEFGSSLYAVLKILHLDEAQFKQLLQEQTNQRFSEEFEDISHLLNPDEDEPKLGVSWKLLEKVFSVETKKRKDGRSDADKPTKKHKKVLRSTNCGEKPVIKSGANDARSNTDFSVTIKCDTSDTNVKTALCDRDEAAASSQQVEDNCVSCTEQPDGGNADKAEDYGSENEESESSSGSDEQDEAEESEDDEDEDEQSLSYSLIAEFPSKWKGTLTRVCEFCIQQRYGNSTELDKEVQRESVNRRHWLALHIKRGQKALFQRISHVTTVNSWCVSTKK